MKKLQALILVCLIFTLSGCMGYREIDKGYLVTAIGFCNQVDNTLIYIESISSSDVINTDSKRVVLYGSGNDASQAYENLKNTLSKPLYFEQLGTVIFEGETEDALNILTQITNINYGVYLIKSNDVESLFKCDTANGVLGYDIISLLKTQQGHDTIKAGTQLYKFQNASQSLPMVNLIEGRLCLDLEGKGK